METPYSWEADKLIALIYKAVREAGIFCVPHNCNRYWLIIPDCDFRIRLELTYNYLFRVMLENIESGKCYFLDDIKPNT
jgi:hypothetical protein